jgi:hypothetical protein
VRRKAARAAAAAADDSDYEDELEARHHHHHSHHHSHRNHSPPTRGGGGGQHHELGLPPHPHTGFLEAMGLPGAHGMLQHPGLMMPPRYSGAPAAKRRAVMPPAISMPGEGDAAAPGQESLNAISLPYMPTPGSTTLDLLNSAMRMPAPLDVFGPGTLEGPPQLLTTTPGAPRLLLPRAGPLPACALRPCTPRAAPSPALTRPHPPSPALTRPHPPSPALTRPHPPARAGNGWDPAGLFLPTPKGLSPHMGGLPQLGQLPLPAPTLRDGAPELKSPRG